MMNVLLRTATRRVVGRYQQPRTIAVAVGSGGGSSHVFDTPHQQRFTAQPNVHPAPNGEGARRYLHLTPREVDHLQLHSVGRLAQYRLARGIKLNYPEAVALITMQMMEKIRDGTDSVATLMNMGQQLLGRHQVRPGVEKLIKDVQVEATFPDGTKLLTVHAPISLAHGDLKLALEGSFLPVPSLSVFETGTVDPDDCVYPGAVLIQDDGGVGIELNPGRSLVEISVTNTGDRPIQVGSHYAFVETNKALEFDRQVAIGRRLNVPSGASIRFEPGTTQTITLTEIAGNKRVVSGNRLSNESGGPKDDDVATIMKRVQEQGFKHAPASQVPKGTPLRHGTIGLCRYLWAHHGRSCRVGRYQFENSSRI
jgi:urease gamma subunit/urease beta subunit